jgi:hypothetical protein
MTAYPICRIKYYPRTVVGSFGILVEVLDPLTAMADTRRRLLDPGPTNVHSWLVWE